MANLQVRCGFRTLGTLETFCVETNKLYHAKAQQRYCENTPHKVSFCYLFLPSICRYFGAFLSGNLSPLRYAKKVLSWFRVIALKRIYTTWHKLATIKN